MNPQILLRPPYAIVYDALRIQEPDACLFEPDYWAAQDRVISTAPGRGSATFIDADFGKGVLRRYLRGGVPGRVVEDRYLFLGVGRSRPFREFHLLADLVRQGLPAPVPIAAVCERLGAVYRGALLTEALEHRWTLSDALGSGISAARWNAIGRAIRRLHDHGVWHADLNARNILLGDEPENVFFVDFDRARYRPGRPVDGRSNLARLRRSLEKPGTGKMANPPDEWAALLKGYHG